MIRRYGDTPSVFIRMKYEKAKVTPVTAVTPTCQQQVENEKSKRHADTVTRLAGLNYKIFAT